MESIEKLNEAMKGAWDDLDNEDNPLTHTRTPIRICQASAKDPDRQNVHRAILSGGGTIPLLKTMLTSACEHNCYYCAFRAGRDIRRVQFTPDEMARTYLALYRVGVVKGLFLSSGVICGGIHSQDGILATAEILRRKHGYNGYLHLKLMPGIQKAQVEQAVRFADRVSINLEGPNPERLGKLAPQKSFLDELISPIRWLAELRREREPSHAWRRRWPSITTQYVVGGAGESDLELLQTTTHLIQQSQLARAYFSRFKPVPGTPLEDKPETEPLREVRLYQASYLLRDYGYDLEELAFDADRNLPLRMDPKLAWAEEHLTGEPVEINSADRPMLLRVPGIGPRSVDRLLQSRARGDRVTEVGQLRRLGILAERAVPYIQISGRKPLVQPTLFPL